MAEPLQLAIPGVGTELESPGKRKFHVSCPYCANRFEIHAQLRGQRVSCPMCDSVLQIQPRQSKER